MASPARTATLGNREKRKSATLKAVAPAGFRIKRSVSGPDSVPASEEGRTDPVPFRLAAASAVREALQKAKPLMLEPLMRVEVETPSEEQGNLLGDLTRRRGNIIAVEPGRTTVVLNAQVPLAELWGYANAIRSLSRGRASYSMTPSHFERVPDALAVKIVSSTRR